MPDVNLLFLKPSCPELIKVVCITEMESPFTVLKLTMCARFCSISMKIDGKF